MPGFARYIGIDYSGAHTPNAKPERFGAFYSAKSDAPPPAANRAYYPGRVPRARPAKPAKCPVAEVEGWILGVAGSTTARE